MNISIVLQELRIFLQGNKSQLLKKGWEVLGPTRAPDNKDVLNSKPGFVHKSRTMCANLNRCNFDASPGGKLSAICYRGQSSFLVTSFPNRAEACCSHCGVLLIEPEGGFPNEHIKRKRKQVSS